MWVGTWVSGCVGEWVSRCVGRYVGGWGYGVLVLVLVNIVPSANSNPIDNIFKSVKLITKD